MKNFYSHLTTTALAVTLLGVLALPLSAQSPAPVELAAIDVNPNFLDIQPQVEFGEVKITLTGPEGFEVIRTLKSDDPLAVELPARDGLYKYELRFSPVVDDETRQALEKARQDGTPAPKVASGNRVMWGTFSISGGQVVAPNREESPSGDSPVPVQNKSLDPEALEKYTISGDLTVYNSLCVGFDCLANETYGSDTIRLKENNLRIHTEDTSGGSFPTTDWRLEFNSNLSGGASYFRVIDATASRNIMTVEAGAPSNSLYVENSGELGIGTANPILEVHAVSGDSPGLRLEQDTSSGFAAQAWDLAGNETSFFVRDATNGSTLPFRIFPGSSSSSLVVRNSNVGVGTTSPSSAFHVRKTDGSAKIFVEETSGSTSDRTLLELSNNGGVSLVLEDTSNQTWEIKGKAGLQFSRSGSGAVEMLMNANGDLTISGGLVTGTAGSCTGASPCDGVFDPEFELPSIEENAASMWSNRHLPVVGPTLPGQPVNLTKKTLSMLHELEKAHIYIEQLNGTVKDLSQHNAKLEERLAAMERLLGSLQVEH